jgi:hemerythrin-like domain-containing protein
MSEPSTFLALDACHRQISEHLERLATLLNHLDVNGVDDHARDEARSIEAFFSETSQSHHCDEEAKVFPNLLATGDDTLVSTIRLLQQDHGWIEEDWIELAPQLRAIASGYNWYDPAELRHAIEIFVELCREHIVLEESVIYPQAKAMAATLQRRRATTAPARFTREVPSSS